MYRFLEVPIMQRGRSIGYGVTAVLLETPPQRCSKPDDGGFRWRAVVGAYSIFAEVECHEVCAVLSQHRIVVALLVNRSGRSCRAARSRRADARRGRLGAPVRDHGSLPLQPSGAQLRPMSRKRPRSSVCPPSVRSAASTPSLRARRDGAWCSNV
jgi:hypothetical protein